MKTTFDIIHETAEKQNFTNKTTQQLEVYKRLLAALDICEQCIRCFDNKVTNIRLIKAIKTANNAGKLSFSLEYDKRNDCQKICIGDYPNRFYKTTISYVSNQIDEYQCVIRLITTPQGRIDAAETIDLIVVDAKEYLKNQIALCEKDLQQYDEEQTEWAELKKQIETYKAKFSYRLQGKIEMRKY
jgi:hypothetical protein